MSIRHLPASASADEICAALDEDGCVVVDNVVRPEVMDEVAQELRPFGMRPHSAPTISADAAPAAPAD